MPRSAVLDTLSQLIRINSINPAYAQGRPESHIQEFVLDFFRQRGIAVREQPVFAGRPNVIATLPGRQPDRRLILEAHCDTAGVEGMAAPFEPEFREGRVYGRGSCDTKAGLAAMMHAVADLKSSGTIPPCEIWFVSAMDEEHSCQGATHLCRGLTADAAVIAEPTEMRLVRSSKGCVRWRITLLGRAAHSSKPHLGVSAIHGMARLLLELEKGAGLLGAARHPLVGSPTLNVGQIDGGTQVNIVPDRCTISIDRRLIPGEKPADVLAACRDLLDRFRTAHPQLGYEMEEPSVEGWPLDTPPDAAIVCRTSEILRDFGLDGEPSGVPFGSDASLFGLANIPAIIFGPGSIEQAHTIDEYVDAGQVEQAFQIYRRLIATFE